VPVAIVFVMFEPLEIPDPLHPAVAHYPVVLTLLGTLLAFGAFFTRRVSLPFWTFLVLLLATVGAQYAVVTGEQESAGQLPQTIRPLIQLHIEWGQRTRTFDFITTCSALFSLVVIRVPRVRQYLAFLTLALGLFTSYSALRAAEHGRTLVYDHAAGVTTATPAPRSSPAASATMMPPSSPSATPTAATTR
jgi:uncharacterized membrane protein